jgi:hypothetical protein
MYQVRVRDGGPVHRLRQRGSARQYLVKGVQPQGFRGGD